jgi:hypothetical protein
LLQRAGEIFFKVDKRDDTRFEVETPFLIVGVKGTEFLIAIADSRDSVTVIEGAVDVRAKVSGSATVLNPGERVEVGSPNEAPLRPVMLSPQQRGAVLRSTQQILHDVHSQLPGGDGSAGGSGAEGGAGSAGGSGGGGGSAGSSASGGVDDAVEDTVETVEEVVEDLGETVEETVEQTGDTVEDVVDGVGDLLDDALGGL